MNKARNGFTIIEMMIVIVIIAILSGFVFRMMGLAAVKNNIAETKAKLEKIANAIEAYRAEYGSYPPVAVYDCCKGAHGIQPTLYEYPNASEMGTSGSSTAMSSQFAARLVNESKEKDRWADFSLFTFGLASYLYPRYWSTGEKAPQELFGDLSSGDVKNGQKADKKRVINQWTAHNKKEEDRIYIQDMDRDMNAIRRILPFLETHIDSKIERKVKVWVLPKNEWGDIDCGVGDFAYSSLEFCRWNGKGGEGHFIGSPESINGTRIYDGIEFMNYAIGFKDSWGRILHYQSNPPYDNFRLWSPGPNGQTCDPVCPNPSSCSACNDDIFVGLQ